MEDLIDLLREGLAGRYQVSAELGKGGMATVFRAEDLKHDRTVAVKVLLPELASVLGSERFLREIQIAASLRHPHILPLLDSGEVGGLPFYVMPFVEGESLRDRLTREKQLPIEEVLKIGREAADALAYAHERGVVHRDIKPANIMLDSGHAVVADFGIALAAHQGDSVRLTVSGQSPGSPQYMSPEQAAGESEVDGRSDIYSLGCVLFEALSGDPPFIGRIPQAIFAKKLREPPPSVSVVRDSVPESLEYLINRSLARSPADRFKNAADLRDALQAVAEGRAVETAPTFPSAARPPKEPGASRWMGMVTTSVGLAFLLLTAVGFLTTRVFDVKMAIPAEFTPSRGDFPLVGLQALVPEIFYAFVALVSYVVLSYAWRLISYGLHRAPGVGDTMDSWRTRSTDTWNKVWTPLRPITVADLFFLSAIVAGITVMIPFRDLIGAMWTSETEVLSLSHRPMHRSYTLVLTLLIMILLLVWRGVFRYLRKRGAEGGRIAASKWGSLTWIVFLLMMVTLPWRLLWNNDHERVLLNGERAYLLVETETEWVIHQKEPGTTTRFQKDQALEVERSGVEGYLFEEPEIFDRGEPVG